MNRDEIRTELDKHCRVVTDKQISVVEYLLKRPGSSNQTLANRLDLTFKTVESITRRLREKELITDNHHVLLQPLQKAQPISTLRLPKNILDKTLPPKHYYYVHVATYLATLEMDEVAEGKAFKGMTKKQVMESIKRQIEQSKDRQDAIMFGVQDRLAEFAIFIGDLEAFKDMQGTIQLPESE